MTSKFLADLHSVHAPRKMNLGTTHARIFANHPAFRADIRYGGVYRIAGTVAVAGTPDVMVARLVVLFDERSKRPIRSQISSKTGSYDFKYVARGPWFIISYDCNDEYNAVIASNKLGDPM